MKTWLKRGAAALLILLAIGAAIVAAGLWRASERAERRLDIAVKPVALPTEPAALERGRYLYASRGCADCHGADGGGRVFVEQGDSLRLAGPNITRGQGSTVLAYGPADWVRTIRHGVAPGGRALRVMPSEDYNRLTDADLGALVAHVQALPPVAGAAAQIVLPLPARVMYGFGAIPEAAYKIDHALPPAQPVPEGVTVEHGRYVANMCLGCHGPRLEGGRVPGGPPDWPAAARLVPGDGDVMSARYASADAFVAMLRSGRSPDGRALQVMPFEALRQLSDTDARALHLYLASLGKP
jgi:mono/diheme cytochrome c family protein